MGKRRRRHETAMRYVTLLRLLVISPSSAGLEALCPLGINRHLHHAGAEPHLLDLWRLLAKGALNATIGKTLSNAAIGFLLAVAIGIVAAVIIHPPAHPARGARSALRHLLRDCRSSPSIPAYHPARPRRRAADHHRLHARRHRRDRQHAQRPRPRAAGAAQDRAASPR